MKKILLTSALCLMTLQIQSLHATGVEADRTAEAIRGEYLEANQVVQDIIKEIEAEKTAQLRAKKAKEYLELCNTYKHPTFTKTAKNLRPYLYTFIAEYGVKQTIDAISKKSTYTERLSLAESMLRECNTETFTGLSYTNVYESMLKDALETYISKDCPPYDMARDILDEIRAQPTKKEGIALAKTYLNVFKADPTAYGLRVVLSGYLKQQDVSLFE